jgi:hypothetical protein
MGRPPEEQPPAEKCGSQNAEYGPCQVAENCAHLLNTVAENMAQPNVQNGSKRLT